VSARISIVPEARRQLRAAAAWWAEYRPAARDLFRQEIRIAAEQLRAAPLSGIRHNRRVRTVLLRKTRYQLFYAYVGSINTIVIVAVWSTSRGEAPPLG